VALAELEDALAERSDAGKRSLVRRCADREVQQRALEGVQPRGRREAAAVARERRHQLFREGVEHLRGALASLLRVAGFFCHARRGRQLQRALQRADHCLVRGRNLGREENAQKRKVRMRQRV
jgi:hypothetical protein